MQSFTVSSAKALLSGALKFADPDQIQARKFLEDVQECVSALESCRHPVCSECDGDGKCGHCGHECDNCDGTGRDDACSCLDKWIGFRAYEEALKIHREREYQRRLDARKSA